MELSKGPCGVCRVAGIPGTGAEVCPRKGLVCAEMHAHPAGDPHHREWHGPLGEPAAQKRLRRPLRLYQV